MIIEAKDYLVACEDPYDFDSFLRKVQAALLVGGRFGDYIQKEGCYIMRAFGDTETIKCSIQHSGMGKIIKNIT